MNMPVICKRLTSRGTSNIQSYIGLQIKYPFKVLPGNFRFVPHFLQHFCICFCCSVFVAYLVMLHTVCVFLNFLVFQLLALSATVVFSQNTNVNVCVRFHYDCRVAKGCRCWFSSVFQSTTSWLVYTFYLCGTICFPQTCAVSQSACLLGTLIIMAFIIPSC